MQRQVTVAPARWWHLSGLSRLIRDTRRLHASPAHATAQAIVWEPRWSPSLELLKSVWAAPVPGVTGPVSMVVEAEGKPLGLGQLRPRKEPHQWEVAFLAVDSSAGGAGALRLVPDRNAARLLGALCDAAMTHSADRVMARVEDEGGRYELFRQLGFSLAVREYSYLRSLAQSDQASPADLSRRIPGLRPQRRSDAHGILRLYERVTPKTVQMAEGKRSGSWEVGPVDLRPPFSRRRGVRRWVVERGGERLAWLQISSLPRAPHVISVLVDDRAGELNQSLVDFALDLLAGKGAASVIVRAREHQTRLMNALDVSGFVLMDAQLLMVKMLATPVLQPQFGRVLEKVV